MQKKKKGKTKNNQKDVATHTSDDGLSISAEQKREQIPAGAVTSLRSFQFPELHLRRKLHRGRAFGHDQKQLLGL